EIEEPAGVVGVDGNGGAELFEGFGPLALLEQFLHPLDASLGIVPVVHDLPARVPGGPRHCALMGNRGRTANVISCSARLPAVNPPRGTRGRTHRRTRANVGGKKGFVSIVIGGSGDFSVGAKYVNFRASASGG